MASNYSGHFVRVSGTWLPAPSTYKVISSTVVNSARNAQAVVKGSVVRAGIRKIEMTWKFLTQAQFSLIAQLFEGTTFAKEVYYYDTITASYKTKQMYAGDRVSETAEVVATVSQTGTLQQINGYKNVKLSLIEVQYGS